jgi:hypothetical protein
LLSSYSAQNDKSQMTLISEGEKGCWKLNRTTAKVTVGLFYHVHFEFLTKSDMSGFTNTEERETRNG